MLKTARQLWTNGSHLPLQPPFSLSSSVPATIPAPGLWIDRTFGDSWEKDADCLVGRLVTPTSSHISPHSWFSG